LRASTAFHGTILNLQKLLKIDFYADLDPVFHSNADPDPASKNNANPCLSGSETLFMSTGIFYKKLL
jgi:hypothetical protein